MAACSLPPTLPASPYLCLPLFLSVLPPLTSFFLLLSLFFSSLHSFLIPILPFSLPLPLPFLPLSSPPRSLSSFFPFPPFLPTSITFLPPFPSLIHSPLHPIPHPFPTSSLPPLLPRPRDARRRSGARPRMLTPRGTKTGTGTESHLAEAGCALISSASARQLVSKSLSQPFRLCCCLFVCICGCAFLCIFVCVCVCACACVSASF